MSTVPPHDHTPHGEQPDHEEQARLHTEGWFLGEAVRLNRSHSQARFRAFLHGFIEGIEERGNDD